MALEPAIKQNWEKLQERYNYPVDAVGRPIESRDEETLNVWQNEGLDRFMQK